MPREPKQIVVDGHKYVIYKFNAIAGREIMAGYPLSAIPKLSEYKHNEEIMLKLMCFVAVERGEDKKELMLLESRELVDNHVSSWETLIKLEKEVIVYNCSFFQGGQPLIKLEGFAQNTIQFLLKTLTVGLVRLLQSVKQHLKNSEQFTP